MLIERKPVVAVGVEGCFAGQWLAVEEEGLLSVERFDGEFPAEVVDAAERGFLSGKAPAAEVDRKIIRVVDGAVGAVTENKADLRAKEIE